MAELWQSRLISGFKVRIMEPRDPLHNTSFESPNGFGCVPEMAFQRGPWLNSIQWLRIPGLGCLVQGLRFEV